MDNKGKTSLIKDESVTAVAKISQLPIDDDGDFIINLKPNNKEKSTAISSIINKIMIDAAWLWRQASNDDLETKQTEPESTNGYAYTIVLASAFHRKSQEKSLSLFQMDERIRATEIKYLQAEADLFLAFLSAEKMDIKNKTSPVALIKEGLYAGTPENSVTKAKNCLICMTLNK